MKTRSTKLNQAGSHPAQQAYSIWIEIAPEEIIELKRISMDRDLPGAENFFVKILTPRVINALNKRGVCVDSILED